MAFTVTATEGGSTSNGIALDVQVYTGQAASQPGVTASATQITPSLSITPGQTGSLVFGSMLGIGGNYTVVAGTTELFRQHSVGGLEYLSFVSTSTSTGGTPETLGYTASANAISICLCEIKQAGTLTQDASTPAGVGALATTITTASFTPPNGSILIAMVQSNGGAGVTTMAISDTSGLGLTWTQQVQQNGTGNGYSGIFTAPMPASSATSGTVQAWSTVPVHRRTSPRSTWRGSAPFTGFVAVAAPKQQPRLLPRRTAARAVVQFTPVVTTNATAAAVSGSVPVQMVQRTEVISRVTGRVIRR